MFGWFRAWQLGSQFLKGVGDLIEGKATSFQIALSVKGRKFVMTVTIDPVTGAIASDVKLSF